MAARSIEGMAQHRRKQLKPRGWRRVVPQPLRLVWRQLPGLFSYPKARLEEQAADYDAYWKEKRGAELGQLSPFQEARAIEVCRLLAPGCSVLDIGCGDGAVLRYLHDELGVEPWGLDQSTVALKQAATSGIRTIHGDLNDPETIRQLPQIDYITALEVLEHVPHPEKLLRQLAPKCRKGFVVSFPNTGYWMHRLRLLAGRVPAQWRRHPGEHLRFWTLHDARWWVQAMGWELCALKTYEGLRGFNRMFPSWCAMGIILSIRPRPEFDAAQP